MQVNIKYKKLSLKNILPINNTIGILNYQFLKLKIVRIGWIKFTI